MPIHQRKAVHPHQTNLVDLYKTFVVHGCTDDGEDTFKVSDDEATFWTVYGVDAEGHEWAVADLPSPLWAKNIRDSMVRNLIAIDRWEAALDACNPPYVELTEEQKQRIEDSSF